MCMFSTPKAPAVTVPEVPVAPQAPQAAPQESDPAVMQKRTDERQRRAKASAANSTLVTGGQGLIQPAATTGLKQAFGA